MNKNTAITAAKILGMGILLWAGIFLPGCKKNFLDRKPLGKYTSANYPYPKGKSPYDQYVFAAYASLRTYQSTGFGYIGAVSIRSDDADKGSIPADGPVQKQMDEFPVMPDNTLCNDLWTGYYSAINKCNVVLRQIETDSAQASPALKIKTEAEARFLRGYEYFMLVRLFGNIPLIKSVSDEIGSSNIPQSPPDVIYPFIEEDLQFAAAHLPREWPSEFTGRATSGAANGMLAKVYLYQKKWEEAMNTAQIVINSGVYDLNTPYDKIFTEAGENSSGSIFEIQAYADANHKQDVAYGGCQYASLQGVRGTSWDNFGWGFNVPSIQLDSAYEPGDPRRNSTILYCPSPQPTRYGEVFPAEPNPRYNMKVYTDPAWRNKVGDQFGWWVNIRILRYSDVLLMYTEAANEIGKTDSSLKYLEEVRVRARNGNTGVLPEITTHNQDSLRKAIRHERRIELAMEGQRFFDIVRWGIADSCEHADGKTNFNVLRDKWLPIPQEQIDLSKGVLKPNPEY